MKAHANAALGPAGRRALVQAIEGGMTAPATAHRWWHRRLAATPAELETGSWLLDRPSRPRRSCRIRRSQR